MNPLTVTLAIVLSVFVIVFGLAFLGNLADFGLAKTFEPAREHVRRETFEQSKAYRQGLAQELQNFQLKYIEASPEHKAALASLILQRTADVDLETLPQGVRTFVQEIRATRGLH
jgi:hypothetical protein